MTFYTRFVSHALVRTYEALGWRVAGTGSGMGGHAIYSTLMRWDGEGNPPEPASILPSPSSNSEECANTT